ncbi:hypothetical protein [Aquabacter spiritensis]|uniref:hypothetical protein n=1 Tax=Aquabacter spiritensis TaxID=933073 RepID=UPI001048FE79|nr:hypothetical protein [Aquabacter spiritensis]
MAALPEGHGNETSNALIQAVFVLYKLLQSIASCIIRIVPRHWRILGNLGARNRASRRHEGEDAAGQALAFD